jgi:hypothetical protein
MADGMVPSASPHIGGIAVKTIATALIALSVLAGLAAPASAFDTKRFFEQHAQLTDPGSRIVVAQAAAIRSVAPRR